MMMDILKKAFPGRSDEQVVPIGLVYAGVRWGRDYRFGDVPEDDTGNPILVCDCSGETYRRYIFWLVHYLYNLDAEPLEEQKGLCKYVSRMEPEDAVLMLGMNAAIYEWDAEDMEDCIQNGEPFSVYWEAVQEYMQDLDEDEEEDYDEATLRELFDTVAFEVETKRKHCPDVEHADVGYRVPLSMVLKRVPEREDRIDLMKQFYRNYNHYASK